ncbi:MAG TPA: ATPase, T2SS/T4P/T4SS family, partial [Burkholderiaceae bacterium]
SAQALVRQREYRRDFDSFADALRASLREDPDVVLVGELRDVETMHAALNAAETGHLVFATLHTPNAVGSVERLVGAFPAEEQAVVRHRLSLCLRAVAAQMLLPAAQGRGRVPVVELLLATPAVSHLIATGRSRQIYAAMDTGTEIGMQTLDRALAQLVRERRISDVAARAMAVDQDTLERLVRKVT